MQHPHGHRIDEGPTGLTQRCRPCPSRSHAMLLACTSAINSLSPASRAIVAEMADQRGSTKSLVVIGHDESHLCLSKLNKDVAAAADDDAPRPRSSDAATRAIWFMKSTSTKRSIPSVKPRFGEKNQR